MNRTNRIWSEKEILQLAFGDLRNSLQFGLSTPFLPGQIAVDLGQVNQSAQLFWNRASILITDLFNLDIGPMIKDDRNQSNE